MKINVLLSSSLMAVLMCSGVLAQTPLIVHEWGTFTTLHGSNGQRLSGLYLEEEHLPDFVYHHQLPSQITDRLIREKGVFQEPLHVTVKMETPVLYFYAKQPMTVDVQANFPTGTISQWFPQRSAGDELPSGNDGKIDFASPFNGWISWKGVQVLAPAATDALTADPKQESALWSSPRATAANRIQVNGETEKFLFYRGIGNFSIPLEVKFTGDYALTVNNTGTEVIPFVFVYEQTPSGRAKVWWSGALKPGQVQAANQDQSVEADLTPFEQALVQAGLYPDEAKAMLRTWENSYFRQPGFRVFWILPEKKVAEMLPLQITPAPAEVKRVFVGRCDILAPVDERGLLAEYEANGLTFWRKHRYYLGIRERMASLTR